MKVFIRLIFLISIIITGSCNNRSIYKDSVKFENISWNRFYFATFEAEIQNTTKKYDILLHIRHLPEFPYEKLKINLTINLPSGEMRTADHIIHFKDKEGNILSECLGDLCDIVIPLRENFQFNEKGPVKFEIENKNPKVETRGIIEVGLELRYSKP
ncbi:MAG: gliding motility lipoprotein GldH [Bacteroidales bacterium]|nr:gliding motility lipoprotein GldH [Bacteroidales bacterium]